MALDMGGIFTGGIVALIGDWSIFQMHLQD